MFCGYIPRHRFVDSANVTARTLSPAQAWAAAGLLVALGLTAVVAFVPSVPTRVLVLLVIAPLVEETLFRTGLHEWLLRPRAARAVLAPIANALTAIAFAAFHLAAHADLLAALTVLPALLIGAVYQRHRRLLPCIALHALFNGLWLLGAGVLAA